MVLTRMLQIFFKILGKTRLDVSDTDRNLSTRKKIIVIQLIWLMFFAQSNNSFILTLSGLQTNPDTYVNSVDPDEVAHLIRSYTVSHFILELGLTPYFQQWICPNLKMKSPLHTPG